MKTEPLPVGQWDASLQPIVEDMGGKPINVHKLMAHHPDLLKAWWNFRNHSVKGGALGARLGELVILRVAVEMKAWYEWASHVDRALVVGLTIDEIERVKLGAQAEGWSPQERLVLQAMDELFESHAICSDTLTELMEHCSLQQVFDLIAIQGMYVILGGMINSFDLDLDEVVVQRLPASINRELFEKEMQSGSA